MDTLKSAVKQVPPVHRTARWLKRQTRRWSSAAVASWISAADSYDILVILGMRRSGNHLVINWIRGQTHATNVFFNNIKTASHPFKAWPDYSLHRGPARPRIILSYEDQSLDTVRSGPLLPFLEQRLAKPGVRLFCGVVLRDPYNLFASRLKKWPERFESGADIAAQRQMYLDHCNLSRDAQALFGDTPIRPIYYNRLLADPAFRNDLSRQFDLAQGDAGLDDVPMNGGGSSFDGYDIDHQQIQRGVFDRWRGFQDDPRFRKAVDDPRVRDIAETLFDMPALCRA